MVMSAETKQAKIFLQNSDLTYLKSIIENVNMSKREKHILVRSELDKATLLEIAIEMDLPLSCVSYSKNKSLKKLYLYAKTKDILIN